MSVIYLDAWLKKQEDISASNSQLPQNTKSDAAGQKPTDEEEILMMAEIYAVLLHAKQFPFTTKSDFARKAATPIALCATEGLLSTQLGESTYTNKWMVTAEGLGWMEGFEDAFSPRH